MVVPPQMKKQVVVKSIGDIPRETTVRARRVNPVPPSSNFGHTAYVPTMVQGIGIINRYYKIAQHPAHTMVLGMFAANNSMVSLSKVRQLGGKTGLAVKGILYPHIAITVLAVGMSVYNSVRK